MRPLKTHKVVSHIWALLRRDVFLKEEKKPYFEKECISFEKEPYFRKALFEAEFQAPLREWVYYDVLE